MKKIVALLCLFLCLYFYPFKKEASAEIPVAVPPSTLKRAAPLSFEIKEKDSSYDEKYYCEKSGNFLQIPARENYAALAKANFQEKDPCVIALVSKERDVALHFASKSKKVTCRFLKALILSGQIEGLNEEVDPTESEVNESISILKSLQSEQPGNGIFPFFIIGSASIAKLSEDQYQRAIHDFLNSRYSESPFIETVVNTRKLGSINLIGMLNSSAITSSFLWPNYHAGSTKLRELSKSEFFASEFHRWTQNLIVEMQKIDEAQVKSPHFDLLQIAFYKGLAKNWLEQTFPGVELPKLISQKGWVAFFNRRIPNFSVYTSFEIGNESNSCKKLVEANSGRFSELLRIQESEIERWEAWHRH